LLVSKMKNFVNDGYGWACVRCRERNADADATSSETTLPRFFREGEAEERETRLTARSLARWKDETHNTLVCPRCGVEEEFGEAG
jgi:hypothetical protein